ncbi:MAG: hydroxymethylbilane synthase [Myxococcales bacterium]|nr:hydroxymethylbilane synthase [Myxococcales bacterium]
MTTLRVATRASDLALSQSRLVAQRIERELGVRTELVPLKTTGDRLLDVSLAAFGGKGLFVKEIEEALLSGRADVAVHSAKDLPAAVPAGLALVAFPERVDPRDALVARERGARVDALPRGARVGTGSLRRTAQLRAHRPDLEIVPLRGNVPTRLRKLETEALDAVVLACAGLERLDLAARIDERIAPEILLPAVGQGTLALEARSDDPLARDLAALNHEPTATSVAAERAFLIGLAGDCTVPLAAFAEAADGDGLRLRALLAASDGGRILRHDATAPARDAEALGARAAAVILEDGGKGLLAALRADAER